MKKLSLFIVSVLTILTLNSCIQNRTSALEEVADSVEVELLSENNEIVDAFFTEFQKQNDGWTKTEAGHKKLVEAFKKKITTDLAFAKACATNNTEYQYENAIADSESISPYSKKNGEEGELKAFDFKIEVKLIKPLYNGQKNISVKYEIINAIPSTVEEHWRPYVDNANYCDVFNPFLNNSYEGTLDLGCYIITNKDKE